MYNKWTYIILLVFLSSCYKEIIYKEPDSDLFQLTVADETEKFIYQSRDTSYTVADHLTTLRFNGEELDLDEIRVRGKSALRFRRKSYAVFLNTPIFVESRNGLETKQLTRFKLIALAQDYTYIENRISFGLLEEAGVMPLFYKFVELRINDATQGIYMLIEDPEQYFLENGSEYILRRGYNHSIDDSEYFPSFNYLSREAYLNRYMEIYDSLRMKQEEELFSFINERLDTDQYFRKMAIDYLLMNGDYTDEIYLYSRVTNGSIRFRIIPWDYDDVFDDQPHEVGIQWGLGTIYGKRYYPTVASVREVTGDRLIFSVEDDLDYTIAMDSVLYDHYSAVVKELLLTMDADLIDRIFDETSEELSSFYAYPPVVEQSRYDVEAADMEAWIKNMEEKRSFLKERLLDMKMKITAQ